MSTEFMPRHESFRGVRIAPSILSADFARLGSAVDEVMDAGARVIHFDVMDGDFVPPITIGPLVASAIADRVHQAGGVLDVHMMVNRPDRQIGEFAKAGADSITFHFEATPHVHRTLGAIRELGCLAGVAINPGTPVEAVSQLDGMADMVLAMSVNPGWGGQKFIQSSPEKISRMRRVVGEIPLIEVDGGVDTTTAASVADAGATLLVAGSAIFGSEDPAQAYTDIAAAAGPASAG